MDILFDDKIYLFERSGYLALIPTDYLEELALRQRARARRQSAYYLKEYLEWCEKNSVAWNRATPENLMSYSQSMPESLGSHNRKIDGVCDFYRFAEKHGVKNPATRFMVNDINPNRYRLKRNLLHRQSVKDTNIDPPSIAEIARFMEAFRNPRNRLIAEVIYQSGMRISEVLSLRREILQMYVPRNRVVNVKIVGKGNKERKVIIGQAVWEKMVAYGAHRTGAYLFSADGVHPLSSDTVEIAFQKASKIAAVRIWPHLLRHAYASQWVHAVTKITKKSVALDANLMLLQGLLGHSSLKSTQIYLHTVDRAAAAELRTNIQNGLTEKRGGSR